KFTSQVVLGNGLVFQCLAINNFELNGTFFPLIWGGDAANCSAGANTELASYFSNGKIVLCDGVDEGSGILEVKAVGLIWSYASKLSVGIFPQLGSTLRMPKRFLTTSRQHKLLSKLSSLYPIATILVSEIPKDIMPPMVVDLSSRGPNPITLDILKFLLYYVYNDISLKCLER
ncbi:LOW QUALITY PROTEIN: hypothetical protein RJ641_035469, partial [Dillenia turbinata]